jgi:hypothetical protein
MPPRPNSSLENTNATATTATATNMYFFIAAPWLEFELDR